jgi:transposase-like protein
MARRKRRTFSPDDKVAILKKHLVDGVPISEVCDEHELQPNQFYTWQRQFFENGAAAFAPKKPGVKERLLAKKVEKLEQKLVRKDEVIAEIGEEYVKLKKELGEP